MLVVRNAASVAIADQPHPFPDNDLFEGGQTLGSLHLTLLSLCLLAGALRFSFPQTGSEGSRLGL